MSPEEHALHMNIADRELMTLGDLIMTAISRYESIELAIGEGYEIIGRNQEGVEIPLSEIESGIDLPHTESRDLLNEIGAIEVLPPNMARIDKNRKS